MWKRAFALGADGWVIMSFTIGKYNDYMQGVSLTLAALSSIIVIAPWVVKQFRNGKKKRKKMSSVRKSKSSI